MSTQKNDSSQTNSAIVADYRARTGGSAVLYERAAKVLPSGITHDARYLDPYSIHVSRAVGPRKWDVDGNEYVDYFGGHGAMLLGHSHPAVIEAVKRQIELGTHYGSSHELEVRWAELVCELIPSAEKVRFTASGTEASHMAIRLARAYTGKDKIVRFIGHFHGWHDTVAAGATSHYDGTTTPGVPQSVADLTILMPSDDVGAVVKLLESRDDIAAVMFEPSGASWGQVPLPPDFIQTVRDVTTKRGVVMLMDEVITGFRWSSGGAQKAFGVTPDLCILAKIVAGGLPGGAVAGKREILDLIDHASTAAKKQERIGHPGTYNANPLSAAAAGNGAFSAARRGSGREGQPDGGSVAQGADAGAGRGGGSLGHLRPVLDLPDLSQPDWRRHRSRDLRSVEAGLRQAEGWPLGPAQRQDPHGPDDSRRRRHGRSRRLRVGDPWRGGDREDRSCAPPDGARPQGRA
jgi:glutamate-1-semialdehyde 2,1-aminomutase